MADPVKCRAHRTTSRCYDGKEWPDPDGWRDDGTYDKASDTIVCDSCYIAMGCPLNPVALPVIRVESNPDGCRCTSTCEHPCAFRIGLDPDPCAEGHQPCDVPALAYVPEWDQDQDVAA